METLLAPLVPFARQHGSTAPEALGHLSGARHRIDCICGWTGPAKPTVKTARAAWRSHRNKVIALTGTQLDTLVSAAANRAGVVEAASRTGAPLVARELLEQVTGATHYRITGIGRGVLAEHQRVHGIRTRED
jgi:hypothetical protein